MGDRRSEFAWRVGCFVAGIALATVGVTHASDTTLPYISELRRIATALERSNDLDRDLVRAVGALEDRCR